MNSLTAYLFYDGEDNAFADLYDEKDRFVAHNNNPILNDAERVKNQPTQFYVG